MTVSTATGSAGRATESGIDAGLVVTDVSKSFDSTEVLRRVSLTVPKGELHALLGASGSGKTTLLRIVGGFTGVDSGRVAIDGRDVTWDRAETRNAGFVFQDYALFPHLTIYENIAFGLRLRKVGRSEVRRAVADACELTRVPREILRRKPSEVSGGQQQRVAIARAMATKPAVLLLDEPLSALDRKVRQEVREELKRVQHDAAITTVFVTHDQEEALYLADRVMVMDGGSIVQSGGGPEVYARPQSEFVAGFVGSVNFLPAELEWPAGPSEAAVTGSAVPAAGSESGSSGQAGPADGTVTATVRLGRASLRVAGCVPSGPVAADRPSRALVAVRPEQLILTPLEGSVAPRVLPAPSARAGGGPGGTEPIIGEVRAVDFTGPTASVRLDVGDRSLTALVFSREVLGAGAIAVGQRVAVAIAPGPVVVPDTAGSGDVPGPSGPGRP